MNPSILHTCRLKKLPLAVKQYNTCKHHTLQITTATNNPVHPHQVSYTEKLTNQPSVTRNPTHQLRIALILLGENPQLEGTHTDAVTHIQLCSPRRKQNSNTPPPTSPRPTVESPEMHLLKPSGRTIKRAWKSRHPQTSTYKSTQTLYAPRKETEPKLTHKASLTETNKISTECIKTICMRPSTCPTYKPNHIANSLRIINIHPNIRANPTAAQQTTRIPNTTPNQNYTYTLNINSTTPKTPHNAAIAKHHITKQHQPTTQFHVQPKQQTTTINFQCQTIREVNHTPRKQNIISHPTHTRLYSSILATLERQIEWNTQTKQMQHHTNHNLASNQHTRGEHTPKPTSKRRSKEYQQNPNTKLTAPNQTTMQNKTPHRLGIANNPCQKQNPNQKCSHNSPSSVNIFRIRQSKHDTKLQASGGNNHNHSCSTSYAAYQPNEDIKTSTTHPQISHNSTNMAIRRNTLTADLHAHNNYHIKTQSRNCNFNSVIQVYVQPQTKLVNTTVQVAALCCKRPNNQPMLPNVYASKSRKLSNTNPTTHKAGLKCKHSPKANPQQIIHKHNHKRLSFSTCKFCILSFTSAQGSICVTQIQNYAYQDTSNLSLTLKQSITTGNRHNQTPASVNYKPRNALSVLQGPNPPKIRGASTSNTHATTKFFCAQYKTLKRQQQACNVTHQLAKHHNMKPEVALLITTTWSIHLLKHQRFLTTSPQLSTTIQPYKTPPTTTSYANTSMPTTTQLTIYTNFTNEALPSKTITHKKQITCNLCSIWQRNRKPANTRLNSQHNTTKPANPQQNIHNS
eukprot:gene3010-1992_t